MTNLSTGLQGVVPGLNISTDKGGAPGAKMNINIRGAGTIGKGSDASPLVLIDGVEGDLSLINQNDIADISILKDAASSAIYGSRAPFGVILITTKKGRTGLSITYNGNVRMQNPLKIPTMLDSHTHALVSNVAAQNAGGGNIFGSEQMEKILAYQEGRKMYDEDGNDMHIDWGMAARANGEWSWEGETWANNDWYHIWLKDHSFSQEHNVTLNGGSDRVTYYVSGRYFKQDGLYNFIKNDYRTMTLNGNFDFKINDIVSFGWNTRVLDERQEQPSAMDDLFFKNLSKMFPTAPLTQPNGDYNQYSFIPSMRDGGQQITGNQHFLNQLRFTVTPLKGWKIYADLALRIESPNYSRQFKKITQVLPNGDLGYIPNLKGNAGGTYTIDKNNFKVAPSQGQNWYERKYGKNYYYNASFRSDYEKTIKRHYFKVLIGTQIEFYKNGFTRIGSTDILDDSNPFIPTTSDNFLRMEKKGEWSTFGAFARINYSWADRYLFEASFRADAASRFPSNQRWGYFPSFSVGWNISQEDFFENLRNNGFDLLKIRGSWGTLGNQNTSSMYPYFQQISTTTPKYVIGGAQANGIKVPDPFSSSITWERVETTNIGADLAFLSNKLTASFEWYQRVTKDMVGPAKSLPTIFGATVPNTNNAELQTRGWELSMGWRDHIGRDWSYEVFATLSNYQDKVTQYDSPSNKLSGFYQGKVLGDIYGYKVKGMAKTDEEMNAWITNGHDQSNIAKLWKAGDLMFEDLDGDHKITDGAGTLDDPGDQVVIGNETPRYQYSLRGALNWKQFDFSMFWQGVGKRELYLNAGTFDGIDGRYARPFFTDHMDFFRPADDPLGENTDAYYCRPRTDNANRKKNNDYYMQNAAYLRLKNVTIGYTVPLNAQTQRFIKNLRVYLSGENLCTFTSLRIFDPEAAGGYGDANYGKGLTYPMFRTYSLGLTATF